MFRSILLTATVAGSAAALVLTLAQVLWISPLILEAETYEEAAATPDQPEHPAWQPENGWPRTLATTLANTALGLGYGLILTGLYALRPPVNAVQGLAWGLAGFAVFFASPGLGLPPELPGSAVAELSLRQHWWLGTALATAAGLGLLLLQTRPTLRAIGLLAFAIPHLYGAPHPAISGSVAPDALLTQFRLATLAANALFWLLLGGLSAAMFQRMIREETR